MNQDSIAFDVGTNFDYKLFDIIEQFDKKHSIRSFYGKLKNDGLPGGRANFIIPDFTFEQLEDYVAECKKRDIMFNYLINPLGMDQNELDPVIGKEIRDFIHKAYDIGIRAFTFNSPLLIKYVKSNFKDVHVTLGLYAYPTNLQHIEYWRSLGVDEITLDHSFNRNFDLLRKVLTSYKDSDLALRVIANNLCLRECPFRLAHGCFIGHSDSKAMSIDYSLINCEYHKISNPTALLTSEWIRPEDIHFYRELAEETGNKNFSIKLVDRTRTTDYIARVIEAYMAEHYDGNLLKILNWPEPKSINYLSNKNVDSSAFSGMPPQGMPPQGMPPQGMPPQGMPPQGMPPQGMPPQGMPPQGMPPQGMPPQGMPPQGMPPQGMPPMGAGGPPKNMPKFRFMDKMKPESFMAYGRTMAFPDIYIDNRKLDGFLEHFINNNNNCRNSLCSGSIVTGDTTAKNICSQCSKWAEKAITYNPAEVAAWQQIAKQTIANLENGTLYKED